MTVFRVERTSNRLLLQEASSRRELSGVIARGNPLVMGARFTWITKSRYSGCMTRCIWPQRHARRGGWEVVIMINVSNSHWSLNSHPNQCRDGAYIPGFR